MIGIEPPISQSNMVQTYGYNLRNLTALQVLDTIWRQVICRLINVWMFGHL